MKTLNLYLLSQSINNDGDTYDSYVVCAETEKEAKEIHPMCDTYKYNYEDEYWFNTREDGSTYKVGNSCWVNTLDDVNCTLIGTAINQEKGVICASYNAG